MCLKRLKNRHAEEDISLFWFIVRALLGIVVILLFVYVWRGLQDYVMAYAWFEVAASQGDSSAKNLRDDIIEEMSQNQIEEGQKLSKELHEKIYNEAK